MENIVKKFKITRVSAVMLLFAFLWNQGVYYLGQIISQNRIHMDFTMAFDKETPFVPWTIVIYFGCFIFWAAVYYYIATNAKERAYEFFLADFIGKLICFIFFVFLPTTNIRPLVVGNDIWSIMVNFLYRIDSPSNLFPSIHCMVSWLCWAGLRNKKECHFAFKAVSFLMAISVCISTLTTKQHVIIDVAGAVLISEAAIFVSRSKRLIKIYKEAINRLSNLILIM